MDSIFITLLAGAALSPYIYSARKAASKENAPGVSTGLRISLAIFFVCVGFSAAVAVSVVFTAIQATVLAFIFDGDVTFFATRPWTLASSYFAGNVVTAVIFHKTMMWHFRRMGGQLPKGREIP